MALGSARVAAGVLSTPLAPTISGCKHSGVLVFAGGVASGWGTGRGGLPCDSAVTWGAEEGPVAAGVANGRLCCHAVTGFAASSFAALASAPLWSAAPGLSDSALSAPCLELWKGSTAAAAINP